MLLEVLEDRRCSPLTLSEFAQYCQHHEHRLENLQFILWIRNYKLHFNDLPPATKAYALRTMDVDVAPLRPSYNRAFSATASAPSRNPAGNPLEISFVPQAHLPSSNSVRPSVDAASLSSLDTKTTSPSLTGMLSFTGKSPVSSFTGKSPSRASSSEKGPLVGHNIPLSEEIYRVVKTFLRPGSPLELTLDAHVRDAVLEALDLDVNGWPNLPVLPKVFLPVEQICMGNLQASFARYLQFVHGNINRPLQLVWYAVGISAYLLGIAISILTIHYNVHRGWRMIGAIVLGVGVGYLYSAFRKYCSIVGKQGSKDARRQLWAWELEQVDIDLELSTRSNRSSVITARPRPSVIQRQPSWSVLHSHGTKLKKTRPTVIGPMKPILDPSVLKMHRLILAGIAGLGLATILISAAIIMPMP